MKRLLMIGLLASAALYAEDDLMQDWVLISAGDLVLKNNLSNPINLTYQVGKQRGKIAIDANQKTSINISAYQLFRSDLKLIWNNSDVLGAARQYFGDQFAKKYDVKFNCGAACCNVACQSDNLIRAFQAKNQRFTAKLDEYKKSLNGTKVNLEFSRDQIGSKVITSVGNFKKEVR